CLDSAQRSRRRNTRARPARAAFRSRATATRRGPPSRRNLALRLVGASRRAARLPRPAGDAGRRAGRRWRRAASPALHHGGRWLRRMQHKTRVGYSKPGQSPSWQYKPQLGYRAGSSILSRMLRATRRTFVVLGLLGFLVRALVPVGLMPAPASAGGPLVFCHGGAAGAFFRALAATERPAADGAAHDYHA